MERNFKGIWIPKDIWLDSNLNWIEKFLIVEIDSLDNEAGCWASNEYFAKFFGVSKDRISRLISGLKNKGYITVGFTYKKGTKAIDKRIVKVTDRYRRKQLGGIGESNETPIGVNTKDNNTSFNNTINNTKDILSNKSDKVNHQENFNRLWELYPKGRKQGKDKAFISYKKAIKDGVTDEVIEKAIEDYKKQIAIQHTELQFIKQGSTWFNQKCWDDEYITENYSKNSGRLKNDRVTQEDEKYFEEIGW